MKQNYNIQFNPPKLTDEQIGQHKDFDALLRQFEAAEAEPPKKKAKVIPMLRMNRMRWIAAAASVLIIGYFGIGFFTPEGENNTISTRYTAPFINPPLEEFQKAFITFEVDAELGGEFEYGKGTKIIIPPHAFVFMDAQGQKVGGKVLLKYREFHDYVDIFLSGIPMDFDSASVHLNMGTAGMMEMYAHHKTSQKPVKLHKNIRIELVSEKSIAEISQYNVYQLDTINRKWEYQTEDEVDVVLDEAMERRLTTILKETKVVQQLSEVQRKIDNLENKKATELERIEQTIPEPQTPAEPQKPNSDNLAFELEGLDPKEHPQLADYRDVIWEVTPDQTVNYDVATSNIQWDDIDIQPIPNSFKYRLTLKKADRRVELIINSALQGNEYSRARATYDNQMRVYNQQTADRQAQLEPQRQALERELAAEEERLNLQKKTYQKRYQQERLIQLRQIQIDSISVSKQSIVNRFNIEKLGIWNCDQPQITVNRSIKATFANENGQPYVKYAAYLVDKRTKSVQRFYTNTNMNFAFNPNTDNLLWLITKDGKIAVFTPADFKKIGQAVDSYTFKLKTIDQPITSEADIREILKF